MQYYIIANIDFETIPHWLVTAKACLPTYSKFSYAGIIPWCESTFFNDQEGFNFYKCWNTCTKGVSRFSGVDIL